MANKSPFTALVERVQCGATPAFCSVACSRSRRTWLDSGKFTLGFGVALGERVRTISVRATKVWPHSAFTQQ